MKEKNNIEEIFKNAFEQYEVDPGDQLWSKIQAEIPSVDPSAAIGNASSVAAKSAGSWITTAVVGGAIALTSVAGYFYFNQKGDKLKQQKELQGQKELVIEPAKELNSQENIEGTKTVDEVDHQQEAAEETSKQENRIVEQKQEVKQKKTDLQPIERSASPTTTLSNSDKVVTEDSKVHEATESLDPVDQSSIGETISNGTSATESSSQTVQSEKSAQQKSTDQDIDLKPEPNEPSIPLDPSVQEEESAFDLIKDYKFVNGFTPNGDGINDVFLVRPDEIEKLGIEDLDVQIYTPSGSKIYEWKGLYGSWDGLSPNGAPAPEGSYLYRMLIYKDGQKIPKQGIVILSR